jgi:hypothetical protein
MLRCPVPRRVLCARACSLAANALGEKGERAIVEAIAANEDSALISLVGMRLGDRDALGMSVEFMKKCNDEILVHLRERRLVDKVKSARGGVR